ncbi:MAG: hypothetical protein LC790_01090, partial [Actinobacteria bacterium]|nr:hypothetical protein [Actinomycetota bacterium]
MTIGAREAGGEVLGPFTRLTPTEAFIEAKPGGEYLRYPYGAEDRPVKVSYTVTPSGAAGTIVLLAEAARRSRPERAGRASGLDQIRRLRGGEREIEDRPAACRATHAVLIAAGEPEPQTLRAAPGDCVIWGNKG